MVNIIASWFGTGNILRVPYCNVPNAKQKENLGLKYEVLQSPKR